MILASATLALGVVYGVCLQRGGFCGAALWSSAVLYKDTRGLVGIGFAVATSWAGFAVLVALDLVVPDPNPLRLLSAVVGGLVFGAGMVLAGGCVSGTLFKAAEGRLTSIIALLGIGLGAVATEDGVLAPVKRALVQATREVRAPPGLHDLVGVPYPAAAGGLAVLGLAGLAVLHVRQCRRASRPAWPAWGALLRGAWPPAVAGVAVGAVGWAGWLLSTAAGRNYPLGVTGGVQGAFSLLVQGEAPSGTWTVLLCAGLLVGSAASAVLRRDWKLRSAEPDTLLIALAGGLLVGFGASVGRGCFVGNMISGLGLLSLHSLLFSACFVAANWITTILYLRGLR